VDDLTLVTNDACPYSGGGDDLILGCEGPTGSVTFFAVAGTTYQIAVGGPFEPASLDTFELSLTEGIGTGGVGPGAGTTWEQVFTNSDYEFYAVAFGCGKIVAGGYPPMLITSPDTINWTCVNAGINNEDEVNALSFSKGLFLAGAYGQLAVSRDAAEWNEDGSLPSGNSFYGSTYGNGVYVNAGSDGTLMTSPDGMNWTVQATGAGANTYDWLYSVTHHAGLFAAVGDDGSVVTSPDGTNWNLAASYLGTYEGDSLYSITYGNGLFVAVGDDGSIVTSPDATNWTFESSVASSKDIELYGVTFGGGRFVAVGGNGTILLSTDGVNWVEDVSGVNAYLYGVTYIRDGKYVIVGEDGTILVNQLPSFTAINSVPNVGLQITLLGLSGATAVVEATPTLSPANWQPILTNTFVNSTIIFNDSSNYPTRFYRALVH
jgi:photosystem II stability/assembly factor-like uncharacterized protein